MSDLNPSSLYNEYYYEHCCGVPYQRDDHWLGFFRQIADHIADDIQPASVLDAGCAWGFLVEMLRDRGVEAWGMDISEYAISKVHESVKPYCWVGSVLDPLPQKYDLLVSIEVLEHLPQRESEQALINLCQYSDDILFSSTPMDYKESTHFNVQQPEYWAELFARQGFLRDVDYDASYITQWAVRFRRVKEPLPRIVRDYERKYWMLWKENTDLRSSVAEYEGKLDHSDRVIRLKEQSLQAKEQSLQANVAMVREKEHALQAHIEMLHDKDRTATSLAAQVKDLDERMSVLAREYHSILDSRSWRVLQRFHDFRHRLIPVGSRRERWMLIMFRALSVLRNEGPKAFVDRSVWKIRSGEPVAVDATDLEQKMVDYQAWIAQFELDEDALTHQREQAQAFPYHPLISFVTPVFNPPPEVLEKTLTSVRDQTYDNWEICLADGASDDQDVKDVLEKYTQSDPRFRVSYLEANLGISGNSNQSLAMAQGEYIALLDHDDLLTPDMLYQVIRVLNEKPETDFIYFDEDKVSGDDDTRRDPFLKPDWSPEMLLSANYLTHPVIRRSLVDDAGGFDPQMDGTQDWDLAFRCTEKTDKIHHIPRILYHWRQISGSTAAQFDAKSYVFDRQIKCVQNHLGRIGLPQAQATFTSPGFLRVVWPPSGKRVSIIIPTKDKVDFLEKCVDSILKFTAYIDIEVLVIDNNSSDPETFAYYFTLSKDDRVRIIDYPEEFNYSAANNFGAKHATGDFLLFLNNDIEALDPGWLDELVRWVEQPEIGAVGAKLLYPDGKIQHAGVVLGMEGHASHVFWGAVERQSGPFGSVDWYRNYMAVTGACMMIRREVFEEIGGFDEEYVLAFSDVEICIRMIKGGYRVLYTPYARLRHHEGISRGDHIPAKDIHVGADQLMNIVEAGDPYFNPNLSYTSRIPMLAKQGEEGRIERLQRIMDLAKYNSEPDSQ
jgi:GT2 family glycosyltransferase/cyclopropane fatty-acyl-phospholipid synthase-like methyltransferase